MTKPSDDLREKRKTRLLAAIAEGMSTTGACAQARVSYRMYREWYDNDANFAQSVEDAIEAGTDSLEDASMRRAKTRSDTLAMFLLKARRPDKYREQIALDARVHTLVEVRRFGNQDALTHAPPPGAKTGGPSLALGAPHSAVEENGHLADNLAGSAVTGAVLSNPQKMAPVTIQDGLTPHISKPRVLGERPKGKLKYKFRVKRKVILR